ASHDVLHTAAVREELLSLIFSTTPAERAALVIDDSLWGGERDHSKKPVPVIRSIIDRALKEGNALLSCEPPSSIICVRRPAASTCYFSDRRHRRCSLFLHT